MSEENKKYIFDTSAILTYIEDEEGSEFIEELLIQAEKDEIAFFIICQFNRGLLHISERNK